LAKETNPDLFLAQQTLRQEQYGVSIAKSSYYSSFSFFSLNYFYGINNNEFATHDEEGANRSDAGHCDPPHRAGSQHSAGA
jgi:hypothetical protein